MKFKNNKGFTLVEMLATVVILGLIMIVALPLYSSVYNSVKSTTYLNTIKTIKVAALDYGSNTYIKDSIKNMSYKTDSTKYDWCKTVNISDLIKAGYIKSDNDYLDQITDLYTGESVGFNSLQSTYVDKSTMSICYCKDSLDIDAFLTKDLGVNQTYVEGEYVRIVKNNQYHTFRYVKKEFAYNDVLSGVIKALKSGASSYTYDGIKMNFGVIFTGVTSYSKDDAAFITAFNRLIEDNLTTAGKCNH